MAGGSPRGARTKKLPALAPGNAAAMPDVRLARRATDLQRAARSADGSWRKVGTEVKVEARIIIMTRFAAHTRTLRVTLTRVFETPPMAQPRTGVRANLGP